MKGSLQSLYTIAERMSMNAKAAAPDVRWLLLKAMNDTLPRVVSAFEPDYKDELSMNLRADRELSKDPGGRVHYDAMIKDLVE